MFRNLPRYDNYRPVGAWLREVPDAWSWEPGRTIFVERKVADNTDEQMLSVTIGRGVVRQAELLSSSSKKDSSNLDKSKYKLVEPGDLVYNKMRAWQGAAGRSVYRGIVSPAYIVMTPRASSAEYFHHVVRTSMFSKEAERWSYGITSDQWSLRPEHFKMIRFPLPSPGEQAAIVKYLAHANARIDKAIAAKRRLVSLLEEQSQVEREACFGAGIANQRLSSVIWEGPTNGTSPEISETGELRTFSISVVRDGLVDVRDSDIKYVPRAAVRDPSKYHLRSGDILLVRGNGNIGLVGRAGLVVTDSNDGIYPDLLMRIRLRSGVSAEYVVAALNSRSVREQIESRARTAVGTHKLNGADVRGIRLTIPELDIQHKIVDELSNIDRAYQPVSEKLAKEISLLKEFRSRLVADVVTGQVDVRAIAATLPDAREISDNQMSEPEGDLEDALSESEK
ncbi:restriction endonuclease subunit S [Corynebacterium dentalis]|uniref:restriction endonuclease subunit S n=1 Tax=Corynebacterium dentalis TaxID=2014528 RepID=UPI0028A1BB25|nr:hypothetical protein [Corynebacterium dentalis]